MTTPVEINDMAATAAPKPRTTVYDIWCELVDACKAHFIQHDDEATAIGVPPGLEEALLLF